MRKLLSGATRKLFACKLSGHISRREQRVQLGKLTAPLNSLLNRAPKDPFPTINQPDGNPYPQHALSTRATQSTSANILTVTPHGSKQTASTMTPQRVKLSATLFSTAHGAPRTLRSSYLTSRSRTVTLRAVSSTTLRKRPKSPQLSRPSSMPPLARN